MVPLCLDWAAIQIEVAKIQRSIRLALAEGRFLRLERLKRRISPQILAAIRFWLKNINIVVIVERINFQDLDVDRPLFMSDYVSQPIPFLLFACAIAWILCIDGASHHGQATAPASPWAASADSNPTAAYRYTINGWEDSTNWRTGVDEAETGFVANVHPLVWSLLLILVVYGLAILASDEKQVRRLWSQT